MQTLSYTFNTKDINPLQQTIMKVVDSWVRNEKTPIPQKEIINKMGEKGEKSFTVANALVGLLRKGYIRKAYTGRKIAMYVQLRGI